MFFDHLFNWWNPLSDCQTGATIEAGVATHYLYDGPNLLGEYNADDSTKQEIARLGNRPVALLQEGDVYYIDTDQLNTPRTLSDQNGTVVWRWEGKPFGDTPANSDPDGDGTELIFNLRFAGQYYDQETGNHYNYFRGYNPSLGRYLQSDPIGLLGGLNTYGYVEGDPIGSVDPYGLAKYVLGSGIESHNGGRDHVHWGTSANPRPNAINLDGSVRHGYSPPNKVINLIDQTFGIKIIIPK